jgi:glucose-1-phosphate thymidylyltransferase
MDATCTKAGARAARSSIVKTAHGVILLLDRFPQAAAPKTIAPRQLMPVANRPLVEHAAAALRDAGAATIFVVTDALRRRVVRLALGRNRLEDIELRTTTGATPIGELEALRKVASEVKGDSIALHRGDSLVSGGLLKTSAEASVLYGADLLGGTSPQASGPNATGGAAQPLGIEFLSPAMVEVLAGAEGTRLAGRHLVDRIFAAGEAEGSVERRFIRNSWRLDETADNILDGNRLALDDLASDWHPDSLLRARIEGRVKIHPSSRIEDALVRGPCVIGANVVIRHAYIGPYTSVGDGCLVENAELEHSLILNDAIIRDIGWRLEHSLVGARAHLSRDFRVPKAVHLQVGDDARISVS